MAMCSQFYLGSGYEIVCSPGIVARDHRALSQIQVYPAGQFDVGDQKGACGDRDSCTTGFCRFGDGFGEGLIAERLPTRVGTEVGDLQYRFVGNDR